MQPTLEQCDAKHQLTIHCGNNIIITHTLFAMQSMETRTRGWETGNTVRVEESVSGVWVCLHPGHGREGSAGRDSGHSWCVVCVGGSSILQC